MAEAERHIDTDTQIQKESKRDRWKERKTNNERKRQTHTERKTDK
jgi:hypothetical protein